MKRLAAAIGAAAALALYAAEPEIAAFSAAAPGAPPAPWKRLVLPRQAEPAFELVADEGRTVLRVRSVAAVGSLAHPLAFEAASRPLLTWRWKVDRVLDKADLARKDGDDFAARVYVSFDVPLGALPFADRVKLRVARLLYGDELPAVALCYVWDNRHPVGTTAWNAYSGSLRMVVVESGPSKAGRWVSASRDVEADFRAAFNALWPGPMPRITGIAVAADTDQTRESVTAWFGDLAFEARR